MLRGRRYMAVVVGKYLDETFDVPGTSDTLLVRTSRGKLPEDLRDQTRLLTQLRKRKV